MKGVLNSTALFLAALAVVASTGPAAGGPLKLPAEIEPGIAVEAPRAAKPFAIEPTERNLAICEAVFRYQCWWNDSALERRDAVFFLSIQGRDPSNSFLRRFWDIGRVIRPGSKFHEGLGLLFRINSLEEVGTGTVEVAAYYYVGNLGAEGYTYWLELRDGKWQVLRWRQDWIS